MTSVRSMIAPPPGCAGLPFTVVLPTSVISYVPLSDRRFSPVSGSMTESDNACVIVIVYQEESRPIMFPVVIVVAGSGTTGRSLNPEISAVIFPVETE